MKKTAFSIVAAMALLGSFTAHAAEPAIYGVWVRDGHPDDKLEFYDCTGKLCARGTEQMPDGSPPPEILRHAAKNGANSWKGDLFNPEDGKTYGGSITYDSATKLTLTGCLMGFLCQSETWTRQTYAKPAAATAKEPAAKEPAAKEAVKPKPKPAEAETVETKPAEAKPAAAAAPAAAPKATPATPAAPKAAPAPKPAAPKPKPAPKEAPADQ
jgi:uncharacterized protein (DUF2147 family)